MNFSSVSRNVVISLKNDFPRGPVDVTNRIFLVCLYAMHHNGKAYDAQKARQDDRNVLNAELFSIYSAMRNGFDAINAKHNEDAFNLYKYSRDSKDELSSEIGELRTELAVLKATRLLSSYLTRV